MSRVAVRALQVVIVVGICGLVLVQLLILPLLASEIAVANPEIAYLRLPVLVTCLVGVATVEVALVAIWRLLTRVERGTVFSRRAFRDVDVVIVSAVAGTLLALGLAVALVAGPAMSAGVLLALAAATVVGAGVALLLVVLRALLVQAVALDTTATLLQAELDEVV